MTRSLQPSASEREARVRSGQRPQIYLLRHGEPDWAPDGDRAVGDPGLTELGMRQAEAAAHRLAREKLDAIYVSPYRRAQQTAAALVKETGIEAVTIEGLAEVKLAIEGLSLEEVNRYFVAGSRRPLAGLWEGWPNAENFRDFHARITQALADVLGRHEIRASQEHDFTVWNFEADRPSIAIVAHGGTNAVALTHLLDIRPVPWEWLRFESELAAYSVVQARRMGPAGHVWSLQNFNELDHLAAADLLA